MTYIFLVLFIYFNVLMGCDLCKCSAHKACDKINVL